MEACSIVAGAKPIHLMKVGGARYSDAPTDRERKYVEEEARFQSRKNFRDAKRGIAFLSVS
jgi:hypothetical protein